jgi:general stress protein 26
VSNPILATDRQLRQIRRAIRRRSYCTLATASSANRPLVAGVLYVAVDGLLYVSSLRTSVKVRNITSNDRVALCIPVRRFPVGPPFSIHLQGRADILDVDDAEIVERYRTGQLKRITSHGELTDPDACVIKITPTAKVATYGLGLSLREILRDPLHASLSLRIG